MQENQTYYDWRKTLTYNADVTAVIGPRGCGKTYGLRKQFIADFLKRGWRFVEICRYKEEKKEVADGYFDKLIVNGEFDEWQFKTDQRFAYIAPACDDNEKPEWEVCGYFIALTEMQRSKKRTFVRVRRLVMDEAIIDRKDRFHSYLPNEYSLLANVVDSCTRENVNDEARIRPNVYLLGNAVDLVNPYFARYGIRKAPGHGYSWHASKTFLLHYIDPGGYVDGKLDDTLAGRMIRGTSEEGTLVRNQFAGADDPSIGKRPKGSEHLYTLAYGEQMFSVWISMAEGWYYVSSKRVNDDKPIFSLTTKSNEANHIVVRKCDKLMGGMLDAVYLGIVMFDSAATKRRFIDALSLFGVR